MEYYTSTLGFDIAMFVKRSVKPSLAETYDEDEKIEAKLESVNKHSMELETRPFSSKKPLSLTRPKDEHYYELDSVVKMVQILSNKIVDLEKDKEKIQEGSSINLSSRKKMKVAHLSHLHTVLLL